VASLKKGKTPVKPAAKKVPKASVKKSATVARYRCKLCGYVYSPLRGEPHNDTPAGTGFDDLPEDYVCPICGYEGRAGLGSGDSRNGTPPGISVPYAGMSTMKNAESLIAV